MNDAVRHSARAPAGFARWVLDAARRRRAAMALAATIALSGCQSPQAVVAAGEIFVGGDLDHVFDGVSSCTIFTEIGYEPASWSCRSSQLPGEAPVIVSPLSAPRRLQHVATFPDALPREDRSAISLLDGKQTRVVYQATESAPPVSNALSSDVAPRAAAALREGETLEVAFFCSVCSPEDNAQPRAEITLAAAGNETNRVEFSFTPVSTLRYPLALPSGAEPGAAYVTLVLFKDGVRYDQIEAPLELLSHQSAISKVNEFQRQFRLAAAGQPMGEPAVIRVEERRLEKSAFIQPSDAVPAITLELTLPTGSERQFRIDATVRPPQNPVERRQFQTQFAAHGFTIGDTPLKLSYNTRYAELSDIDAMLRGTYEALSCLTIARTAATAAFRDDLKNRHNERCQNAVQTRTVWSDSNAEAERAAKTLYDEGSRLFLRLFGNPETSELARFLVAARAISEQRAAERLPGGALKMRYHALEYHIPLQLAHPPVSAFDRKAPQFFGLAFNIVAGKGAAGSPNQPFVAPMTRQPSWNVAFAAYASNVNAAFDQNAAMSNCGFLTDPVALQSCEHYGTLLRALRLGNRTVSVSAPMFESVRLTSELKSRARSLNLMWTFAHGLTRYDAVSGNVALRGFQDARLILSQGTPPFYPSLIDSAVADIDPEVFKQHPLVVLLACETGVAGSGGTSGLSFPQAFINAGAIGVVATESEVNGPTASLFGEALLSYLMLDRSPSESVLMARRTVFAFQNGNLWPLLFHYAGSQSRFREN